MSFYLQHKWENSFITRLNEGPQTSFCFKHKLLCFWWPPSCEFVVVKFRFFFFFQHDFGPVACLLSSIRLFQQFLQCSGCYASFLDIPLSAQGITFKWVALLELLSQTGTYRLQEHSTKYITPYQLAFITNPEMTVDTFCFGENRNSWRILETFIVWLPTVIFDVVKA